MFSDGVPAKELDFIPGKPDTAVPGADISIEDAIEIIRAGGDVIAADEATARAIAEAAGFGQPVRDPPHGPGQRPHYHPTDGRGKRLPGHILF